MSSVKAIAYSLDEGNNRSQVDETTSGGTTTTNYTLENDGATSPTYHSYRYSAVAVGADTVTPTYDNEGNLTYDGHFYYVYDFKNRLSEVWVATGGSSSSSMVLQQQTKKSKPIKVSKKNLAAARKTVLDRFGGSLADPLKAAKKLKQQKDLEAQGTTLTSETFTLSLMAAYGYDPMNRRVLRLAVTDDFYADHRYAYDGWREVEELTPVLVSGSTYRADAQKSFVWGSRIDELLSYRKLDGTTWVSYYLTQGKLDNVVSLQSSGGTVVETVEYDPYGKASVFVGSSTTPAYLSSVDNPYLFQGRRLDVETGFLHFRNRYLSTEWGRFLTNDPIGVWGDAGNLANGVAFVGNAPAMANDPLGLHMGLPASSGGDSGSGAGAGNAGFIGAGGPGHTGDVSNPPGVLASTGPNGGGTGAGSCGCGQETKPPASDTQGPASKPSTTPQNPVQMAPLKPDGAGTYLDHVLRSGEPYYADLNPTNGDVYNRLNQSIGSLQTSSPDGVPTMQELNGLIGGPLRPFFKSELAASDTAMRELGGVILSDQKGNLFDARQTNPDIQNANTYEKTDFRHLFARVDRILGAHKGWRVVCVYHTHPKGQQKLTFPEDFDLSDNHFTKDFWTICLFWQDVTQPGGNLMWDSHLGLGNADRRGHGVPRNK